MENKKELITKLETIKELSNDCLILLKEYNNPRDLVNLIARSYIGKIKYKYGGKDENGIDCSGFVQKVLLEAKIDIPKTITNSLGMREWGREVESIQEANIGDIICYNGHCALYMGGGMIIDAGQSTGGITERKTNILPIITIRDVIDA